MILGPFVAPIGGGGCSSFVTHLYSSERHCKRYVLCPKTDQKIFLGHTGASQSIVQAVYDNLFKTFSQNLLP